VGEAKTNTRPAPSRLAFLLAIAYESKLHRAVQIKKPRGSGALHLFCGERGIRTFSGIF